MDFIMGCNYWASHAGTEMWRKWDEAIVREDLKKLAAHGATWLRVFPNWRDFQPVKPLFGGAGKLREYVTEEETYFDNPYYLDPVMVERFACLCRIAEECGFGGYVNFYKAFQKQNGCAPGVWRQNMRKEQG